jgi:hypothetical protein
VTEAGIVAEEGSAGEAGAGSLRFCRREVCYICALLKKGHFQAEILDQVNSTTEKLERYVRRSLALTVRSGLAHIEPQHCGGSWGAAPEGSRKQ